ncbi:7-cyano-7-deazaguanine synthase QueC [Embleya sp. NPDC059237]|uniref:7-cyano-7-deazaguanine synthase QueC n=1 Tax=Embleya sp. NPDC059237 TaxID=3346784 RepID=UPI0036BC0E5C
MNRIDTRRHAVVVASGGLDSTTVAYLLAERGHSLTLLSVDYGQRHRTELDYAAKIAGLLLARHEIVDLTGVGALLTGSALTDPTVPVPDGRYTQANMRSTVVPNRNAILLAIAAGLAVSTDADLVAFGAHSGDHTVYPDCRPAFFDAIEAAILAGNEGFTAPGFRLEAPFLHLTKADVVLSAAQLGVPFELTWSCYRGGSEHCGTCSTCIERRQAFTEAGVPDPTRYAHSATATPGAVSS